MKIKVGLIGKGKWGLKIKKKLAKIADLKFVIGKKKNFFNDIKKNNIRWVFIATPNTTHYSIVKKCLKTGINVFCEKPLCLSLIQAKTLVNLAKKKNLKLYVSDLYSFYSSCLKKLNIFSFSEELIFWHNKIIGRVILPSKKSFPTSFPKNFISEL